MRVFLLGTMVVLAIICVSMIVVSSGPSWPTTKAHATTQLDGPGFALVSDPARQQLYVSVPSANEIDVLSMSTLQIVNRVHFGGQGPTGVSLSIDGSKLYVALNLASAVGVVDLASMTITTTIDAAQALGDSHAWDVVEATPNRVFVSANPGSSGFSWLAVIQTDEGNQVSRILPGNIIRAAPVFVASNQGFLYVGESAFSPQSLHKIDAQSTALLVDAPFGSVSGTDVMDISPDGTRLYLGSGQVLRTDTLTQVGATTFGAPRVSGDGTKLFVGTGTTVREFDRATLTELDQHSSPCDIRRLVLGSDASELFALGSEGVCRVSRAHPTATSTATQTAAPTFPPSSTPTPLSTFTPSPVSVGTSTSTPVPVSAQGGSSGPMKGLFGTVAFPASERSSANVAFDRPVASATYTVLLTPENRNCTPMITSKTVRGFSFSCSGVGGAVDWAVLQRPGKE